MAKNEAKRLTPKMLAEDRAAFDALQSLSNYTPTNPAYSVAAITQVANDMRAAQTSENQAQATLDTARDIAAEKEWAFHNLMLAVKDQVRALYGKNSVELQALGLKRESEYKRRGPKRGTTEPTS